MRTLNVPEYLETNADGKNIKKTSITAETIVKTDTDIIGYDADGTEVFAFRGISDFSQFTLAEGQVFDTEDDPMIDLQQQNAQILFTFAQQTQMIADLQTQNAAIMLQLAQSQPSGGAS
jgi:hypothetical protein